jgi:hypothetical protein
LVGFTVAKTVGDSDSISTGASIDIPSCSLFAASMCS